MSSTAAKPAMTPIPVQLSDTEFHACIFPHFSMPKRGPKRKLGYHRLLYLILRWGNRTYTAHRHTRNPLYATT
jgi:hypothetical protein